MAEDDKKEVTFNMAAFDPEQYVMIARFMEPFDAQMAKGVLDSASLECFLYGENANNLMAPALHSHLVVHRKDEETARKLLEPSADTEGEDGNNDK